MIEPSYSSTTGNGVTTVFPVPFPYLRREDVRVRVAGAEASFAWNNAASISIIPAPASGTKVEIERVTEDADLSVVHKDTSTLKADDLNKANLQSLYLIQEDRAALARQALSVDEALDETSGKLNTLEGAIASLQAQLAAFNDPYIESVEGAYPVFTREQFETAVADPAISTILIMNTLTLSTSLTGTWTKKTIIARQAPLLPTFEALVSGMTMLDVVLVDCDLRGVWNIKGVTQDTPSGTGIRLRGGSDEFRFHYLTCRYLDTAVLADPVGGRVYAGKFDFVDFNMLTSYGFRLYGENSTNTVTYFVVSAMHCNSDDSSLTPVWWSVGDNVGSGGSQGITLHWGRFYRGATVLHTWSNQAPLGGNNTAAPRKIFFHHASCRGTVSHGIILDAGEDIHMVRPTVDDADIGILIGKNFTGHYEIDNPIIKDCRYEGVRHDSGYSTRSYWINPRVSNCSYKSARVAKFVFSGNPAMGGGIVTVNGKSFVLVVGTPEAGQAQIGVTLEETLENLRSVLAESFQGVLDISTSGNELWVAHASTSPIVSEVSLYITAVAATIVNTSAGVYDGMKFHPSADVVVINPWIGPGASWRRPTGWFSLLSGNAVDGDYFDLGGTRRYLRDTTLTLDSLEENEIALGASAQETLRNIWDSVAADEDDNIAKMSYILDDDPAVLRIYVTGKIPGQTQNGYTIGVKPATNLTRSGATVSVGTGEPSHRYGLFGGPGTIVQGAWMLAGNVVGETNLVLVDAAPEPQKNHPLLREMAFLREIIPSVHLPAADISSNLGASFSGNDSYRGSVQSYDGRIYCIPYNATTLLHIDPDTDTAATGTLGASLSGSAKYRGGGLGSNGKIYAFPYNATDVLAITPGSPGTATNLSAATLGMASTSLDDANKWSGGSAGLDGKLYGAPYTSTDVLVVNPTTETATRTTFGLAAFSGSAKYAGAALATNGRLFMVPYNATTVLVIETDPKSQDYGKARRTTFGADLGGSAKFIGASSGADGKIYCCPHSATDILVIDPITLKAVRTNFGLDLTGSAKWAGIVPGPDGRLYCLPYDATDFLIIDPMTQTAVRNTLGAAISGGQRWLTGHLAKNNRIYGVPYDAATFAIIGGWPFAMRDALAASPFLNKA